MVLLVSTLGLTVVEYFDDKTNNSDKPLGIPRNQIPPGNEDMYVLKSQVVPPVCPKCPEATSCPRTKKCQPCPPLW